MDSDILKYNGAVISGSHFNMQVKVVYIEDLDIYRITGVWGSCYFTREISSMDIKRSASHVDDFMDNVLRDIEMRIKKSKRFDYDCLINATIDKGVSFTKFEDLPKHIMPKTLDFGHVMDGIRKLETLDDKALDEIELVQISPRENDVAVIKRGEIPPFLSMAECDFVVSRHSPLASPVVKPKPKPKPVDTNINHPAYGMF